MSKKRVIVDCDPGIDDALAIQYLLEGILSFYLFFEITKNSSSQNIKNQVDIVAVTIVDGNCKTHQGAANALRIFKSNNIDDIPPIYLGEDFPKESHDNWYGLDGLGNQQGLAPIVSVDDVKSGMFSDIVTNKTAGQAIVDLTVKNKFFF